MRTTTESPAGNGQYVLTQPAPVPTSPSTATLPVNQQQRQVSTSQTTGTITLRYAPRRPDLSVSSSTK
jgi:hypothetical protein